MKLKVGTDFSGIGSPETALKRLNIPHENVFACDIDKYAKASYLELHDPGKFYDNITTRDHTKVERLDLYVAGFPCQAFSYAGKREGFADETRGTLFFDVAEFIRTNKPTCFILENVRGLVSHDKGRTFQTITDILSNGGGSLNGQVGLDTIDNGLGYHVYYKILNSKDFGVPQNRERIFIVGFRNWREFSFPKEMPLDKSLKDVLEDNVDEKFYLSKKMIDGFYKHKERHEKKGTGFKFEPKDGSGVANCLRANAALCPTDNTIIETDNQRVNSNYKKHKDELEDGDFMDSYNQTIHKDITPTITTRVTSSNSNHIFEKETKVITHSRYGRTSKNGNGGSGHLTREDGLSYCVDTGNFQAVELDKNKAEKRIRRLTPLECWRLQGFSDEDLRKAEKVCSNSQLYKQAGNSITVDVMVEIFKKMYLK